MYNFREHAEESLDRLREDQSWGAIPSLFIFGLVLLVTGHVINQMNPRLGTTIDLPQFQTEAEVPANIRIEAFVKEGHLLLQLDGKLASTIPLDRMDSESLEEFTDALNKLIGLQDISIALSQRWDPSELSVVLALDSHLNYHHARALLGVLAKSGITHYAFETLGALNNSGSSESH